MSAARKPVPVVDGEEVPLCPVTALAHALAASQGRWGPSASDIADAAFALVDLRAVGWDVRSGLTGRSPAAATILSQVIAAGLKKPVTPKGVADAERAVLELRNLAFDMWEVA